MMRRLMTMIAVAVPLVVASVSAGAAAPVAKVKSYDGTVQYSKNGQTWREVRRPNKYLLPGYTVRTGRNSSAQVVVQSTGETHTLGSNTVVRVNDSGLELISGELSKPEVASGSFFQALYNKFLRSQRYTTVRRGTKGDPTKFKTARSVTVSETYPDLAWQNVGPGYSYRLEIDGKTYDVPVASTAEMIRFTLPKLSPGEHEYRVSVMQNGEVVFTPRRPGKLVWLSEEENREYLAEEQRFRSGADADPIMLAAFQSDHGFKVAALDTYRAFFKEYPDENEVRPMLAEAYAELGMADLQSKEAQTYQTLAESDQG